MDEGPSRPVARHSDATAGTPSGNTTDIPTAVIQADQGGEGA